MATRAYALVPLFEKFIKYSYKGKRLKPDGNRIKPQTVDNYVYPSLAQVFRRITCV